MERKKVVRKRSPGRKKRTRSWLVGRKVIPFLLLLLLLLFSMAVAGYVIFFHATLSYAEILTVFPLGSPL